MSISVIIPIKNRAHLLPATLESILTQSEKPAEIIVVDDHSTDNIADLKEEYKDKAIFLQSAGRGPGAARNTGFLASTGKLIQFFDSDDLMTHDKLSIQSEQLQHSASGMAYCPHVKAIELPDGKWKQIDSILYYKPLPGKRRYDQWVIRGACMITQSCLFKRELLKEAGLWREDLMSHEDLEFLFRIGKSEPYPLHSPVPAVIYRQHEYQITDKNTTNKERALDQLNAWRLILQQMKDSSYSFWDRKLMSANIIGSSLYVDPTSRPADYNKLNTFLNQSIFQSNRILNKVQRTFTRSDWRFVHGISNDREHFNNYIMKVPLPKTS
jgi:glycosyltransferase involved in cell wall biosynthesis